MKKLIDEVKKMEDKRQQWKVKHLLCDIVIIVMLSVLTGHNDFEEIVRARWRNDGDGLVKFASV